MPRNSSLLCNFRGDVKRIVVVLGGAHHNMGWGGLGPGHNFFYLLSFVPEASKMCKNTIIFFLICVFCPFLRVVKHTIIFEG